MQGREELWGKIEEIQQMVVGKKFGKGRRNKMRKAILNVIKGQYFFITFSKMYENMHISCLCVYAIVCGSSRACVWSSRVRVSFLTHLEYLQCSRPVSKIRSVRFI